MRGGLRGVLVRGGFRCLGLCLCPQLWALFRSLSPQRPPVAKQNRSLLCLQLVRAVDDYHTQWSWPPGDYHTQGCSTGDTADSCLVFPRGASEEEGRETVNSGKLTSLREIGLAILTCLRYIQSHNDVSQLNITQ